ncbi:AMP-dependent synthetase and ligase [Kribbella flavida DSM 17836]|uniref:AMP-dependent synthetase and ligase n=1 Tax=Kribbella flavida (strain DSM 17836 / JCM 10339 / NBRC 14399) TaxID=479435 RepID=D2PWZ9_KRIFD|nr:AMP-binding protein [Kribbella flavida]ADB35379.1 AMP-dependent synthetase and ligase [Kribbella flavida DSM 17836]
MNFNFADVLRDTARRHGDRLALVDGDRRLTWSELDAAVEAAAHGYAAAGLVPGYRVVLLLANSVEFVTSYLGCLRAGLVAVPLNTGLTRPEIANVVAHSGARLVVADGDLAAKAEGVRVVRAGELSGHAPLSPRTDPESLAVLLYTSGTSGEPRAAMLPHRALAANVENLAGLGEDRMGPDDVVLGVLPMFHAFGLNAVLGWAIATGAALVVDRRFDSTHTVDLISRYAVTRLPLAPPALQALLARDDLRERLASVKVVLTGASTLDRALADRFEQATGLFVHQGYGLTEASPGVTTTLGQDNPKPGSVGRPLPGVDLRIADERGEDVEGDDPGEILVRGLNLFSGYWPDGSGGPDEDGWYRTGDVGYLDADGDLFLVDRLRELVIVSGFNVFPSEVEEVLVRAPGVREAAVIGVPSAETGEAVKAFVVPATGAAVDVAEVRAYAGQRLARFKCPVDIEVVDHLPHSVTGKVAKGRLREADR